jgi:hypothetical protein
MTTDQREALAKAWRLLNLQTDTMLERAQRANADGDSQHTQTEIWKVVVTAMGAGAEHTRRNVRTTRGGTWSADTVHALLRRA